MQPEIITAGAYININGRFPFVVGPSKRREVLGVVRIGGHREYDETGWECAAREVFEEAGIRITPQKPPMTYWIDAKEDVSLEPATWPTTSPKEPTPFLVRHQDNIASLMFLANSTDTPIATPEVHGILLLTEQEITHICRKRITLEEYLQHGGQAVFREELPLHYPLMPYPQLRLFARLLKIHPEIAGSVVTR